MICNNEYNVNMKEVHTFKLYLPDTVGACGTYGGEMHTEFW
jgi:hypothetical protein